MSSKPRCWTLTTFRCSDKHLRPELSDWTDILQPVFSLQPLYSLLFSFFSALSLIYSNQHLNSIQLHFHPKLNDVSIWTIKCRVDAAPCVQLCQEVQSPMLTWQARLRSCPGPRRLSRVLPLSSRLTFNTVTSDAVPFPDLCVKAHNKRTHLQVMIHNIVTPLAPLMSRSNKSQQTHTHSKIMAVILRQHIIQTCLMDSGSCIVFDKSIYPSDFYLCYVELRIWPDGGAKVRESHILNGDNY